MKVITIILLIFSTICVAHARTMRTWSYQELYDEADLVIIAKPISTQDTAEKTTLPNIAPDVHVVGLSTEFEISVVMKGDKNLKKSILKKAKFGYTAKGWAAGYRANQHMNFTSGLKKTNFSRAVDDSATGCRTNLHIRLAKKHKKKTSNF